jgi:hypothetical protein
VNDRQAGGLWGRAHSPSWVADLERPPAVERYAAIFSHLIAKALDPDESRSLIAQAAAEMT